MAPIVASLNAGVILSAFELAGAWGGDLSTEVLKLHLGEGEKREWDEGRQGERERGKRREEKRGR